MKNLVEGTLHHHLLYSDPNSHCINGKVRLAGGRNQFEGRVEVCIGGEWSTVCEDIFWDNADARVICRQIGYNNPQEALAVTAQEYGRGVRYILLNGTNCTGRENRITECSTIDLGFFRSCNQARGVGVICRGTKIWFVSNTLNESFYNLFTTDVMMVVN